MNYITGKAAESLIAFAVFITMFSVVYLLITWVNLSVCESSHNVNKCHMIAVPMEVEE